MKTEMNKTENPPPLIHFKYRSDYMCKHESLPEVELEDEQQGYGLVFKVTPTIIKIRTSRGGGHGDRGFEDKGRSCAEWADLLLEAKLNQEYYFTKS